MQQDGVMCKYFSKNQTKYFLMVKYLHPLLSVFGQEVKEQDIRICLFCWIDYTRSSLKINRSRRTELKLACIQVPKETWF